MLFTIVTILPLVSSTISPVIIKDMSGILRRLRTAADTVAAIPSLQRLAEAEEFLREFGPRSEEAHHLSFADDQVATKASEGRDCLASARVVIAALTNDIAGEILVEATVAEAQRLTKCLVDVRKSAALFEGLYAKYEKQRAFKAAMNQATAALETLSFGTVKTARSQFASTTQRQFWSAETKDEVDAAVDAITTKLAEFDIHRLLADHDKVVAEEEARRQEDEQRRIEQLRQEKERDEQRRKEVEEAKQRLKDAAQKRRDEEAKASAALKERKQLQKAKKSVTSPKASLAKELAVHHADLEAVKLQILNKLLAAHKEHVEIYSKFLLFGRGFLLLVVIGLMPNYFRADNTCSLGTFSDHFRTLSEPVISTEIFMIFIMLEKTIAQAVGKPGPVNRLVNTYQVETVYDAVHCFLCYYFLAVDVTGFDAFKLIRQGFPIVTLCPDNNFNSMAIWLQDMVVRLCAYADGVTDELVLEQVRRELYPVLITALLVISIVFRVLLVGQLRHNLIGRMHGKRPRIPRHLALRALDKSAMFALKAKLADYPEKLEKLYGEKADANIKRQAALHIEEFSKDIDLRLAKILDGVTD